MNLKTTGVIWLASCKYLFICTFTFLILYLEQQCTCECTYMHSRGFHPVKWKCMSGMEPVCRLPAITVTRIVSLGLE